ncbi:MAG: hypothetical protein J7502_04735 [Flavisolibacter sp.]|nr:hypothetical protein [Flavisolibacter sp.]
MKRKLSPEKLSGLRRLRLARRLWKKEPLFAFDIIKQKYPDCTYEQFLNDLVRRTKPKPKKSKSGLQRFGRYNRMVECASKFKNYKDVDAGLEALKLRKYMTSHYRVLVWIGGKYKDYFFSPLISFRTIRDFHSKISLCKSEQEVEDLVEAFTKSQY